MARCIISLVMILLAALSLPLSASQARTYQDGLKKAGDDKPLVLFCYGANFDRINIEIYNKLFKERDRTFVRVINKEHYVVVPVYQLPSDSEKREMEKVLGKGRLPGGIRSYPCIAIVDGQGRFRAAVQSAEELESPEKAAAALTSLLADFRKQQKLLEQANRSKGASQDKLMIEALSISSIQVPGHGTYDPANNGLGEKLQVMDLQQANSHVRHIIANGKFTPIERQMILVAYAGHMRRTKGHSLVRLRALYTEIRNIDPNSIYGRYAQGALELWVIPFEKTMEETSSHQKVKNSPAPASDDSPDDSSEPSSDSEEE